MHCICYVQCLLGGVAYALTNTSSAVKIANGTDLWDSSNNKINNDVLTELGEKLFGTKNPIDYIKSGNLEEGSYVIPASTIGANVNNSNGIVLNLGGVEWMATSLTLADTDKGNNQIILTLFQANSPFSSQYYSGSNANVKGNNMYSSSTVRNLLLTDSYYAQFSSGDISNYLVKPKYISYQQTETIVGRVSGALNIPNDALGALTSNWNPGCDYQPDFVYNGIRYDAWGEDYIWLPSLTETGAVGQTTTNSIWQLNSTQLAHSYNGRYPYSWLRSGVNDGFNQGYVLRAASGYIDYNKVTDVYGVRPAIHLNLSEAGLRVKVPTSNLLTTYNSQLQDLQALKTAGKLDWYYADMMTTSYEGDCISAGEHKVTVTLPEDKLANGEYIYYFDGKGNSRTHTYTITISKKPIAVTFSENADGIYTVSPVDISDIYITDTTANGRAPVFGVSYDSSDGKGYHFDSTTTPTHPNKVGSYIATAEIINNCNYEIDKTQTYTKAYTKNKTQITRPTIPVASKEYNGQEQEFTLMDGMNMSDLIVVPSGDMTFDKANGVLKAKNAGKYSIRIALADTTETEWRDGTNKSEEITLQVEITKKPLTLSITSDAGWTWKADQTPTITITGDSYANDRTELYIYYYKNGDSTTKYDDINNNKVLSADKKTRTIVMPKLEPGIYVIGIEIFGSSYTNDCYQLVGGIKTQSFTVEGSSVTLQHPIWKYNGTIITDTSNVKFTYTGSPFNFTIDEDDLRAHGMEIDISRGTNGFAGDVSATNFGTYQATVYLKSLPNYEQQTQTHVLNYTIEKAKYDLSGLSWNYGETNKRYFKKATPQSVELNGILPTGLTARYSGNGVIPVGSYSTSVTFRNSNDNYLTPVATDSSTYIGTFAWTCSWEIEKATLNANWNSDTIPKLRPVGDISLHEMVNYTYYETDSTWNKLGGAIPADQIGNDKTKEQYYIVEATLKTEHSGSYVLNPTLPTHQFSVGSNKYVVQLYITFNGQALEQTYAYTGVAPEVGINFTVNPSGLDESNIIITYYKNGSSQGSTDVPTAVGSYHAVISVNIASSVIEDNCAEFDFEIVKADFDVSGLKWQYTHGEIVATYDASQAKWIDSENREITNIKFDGTEHIIKLIGLDTLPASLRANIVGENSQGQLVFKNAGNNTLNVNFVYDNSCYNAPNFASSIAFNIAKANIDTSNIVWGYVINNGKTELPYTGGLDYARTGTADSSSPVSYTLKLINVPEELAACIKYTGDITKANVNVLGSYQVSYSIDNALFNTQNFEQCSMPAGLKTTLDWEIKPIYLDIPVYNGTWTIFDDNIHNFAEMCGLQSDWYLYYDMTITKDGNPYTGLNGDIFASEVNREIKAYDVGNYVLKFTLKNSLSDFYWKSRFQDITISVDKIRINIIRWQKAGISAEVETDFADFKHYTEYQFKDKDGIIMRPEDVVGALNAEIIKQIIIKSQYGNNVELIGETEHKFTTGESGRTFVEKPTLPNNLIFTGTEFDIEAILTQNAGEYNYKPLIMSMSGDTKATNAGTYTITITLTDPAYRWENEDPAEDTITLTWEIKDKEKEVLAKPSFPEIFYTGSEIDITSQIIGFNPDIMEIVEGSQTKGTTAGTYTITIRLKNKDYTWKTPEDVQLFSESEFEEISLTWEIKKARIVGTWEVKNGYSVFVPANAAHADKFATKYFDKDGNEVAVADMVDGETYKAQIVLNDAANYEFVNADNAPAESEKEFSYVVEKSFIDFIKENWLWFVVGIVSLVLLIILILIIIAAKKRKKKKAEQKAQEAAKTSELSETEKLRAELEKAELERKLAEVRSQNNIQQQQFNNQAYVQPQYQNNTQAPFTVKTENGYSIYDSQQDYEIQKLKEEVRNIKKFDIASDEERNNNRRLARIENMLMNFLLNNFANNPNWIPFSNQDMIDYPIEELMKVYAKAKLSAETNSNIQNIKQVESEARNFEGKVEKYYEKREDSKYEELLKEIRELKANNEELERKFEQERERNVNKELEKAKQDLAKTESELSKSKAEVENLKEKNSKHEQEKLVEEIVKKNETLTNNAIPSAARLEIYEAYNQLSEQQKQYFNTIRDYALMQPNAKLKITKFYITVGVGNKPYVKLVIKRNNVIACFKNVDDDAKNIKKGDVSIKEKETEIKIIDKNSINAAKHMIDLKVSDINSN